MPGRSTIQTVIVLFAALAGCRSSAAEAVGVHPGSGNAKEFRILVKDGETVAFLGDSITAGGANYGGYCRLVVHGLRTKGIEVEPVLAGVSGNTSEDMLARLDESALRRRPDWVVLAAGVNDVWHSDPTVKIGVFQPKPGMGVKLQDYRKNVTEIVDRCSEAGARVILTTITPIREDPEFKLNITAHRYNAFLRQLAEEHNLPIADLNGAMFAEIARGVRQTSDGVHPLAVGHRVMAAGVLQSMGFTREESDKLEEEWQHSPSALILGDRQTTSGSRTGGWIHLLLDGLNSGLEMVTSRTFARYRQEMTVGALLDGLRKELKNRPRYVILQAPRGDAVLATPLAAYRRAVEELVGVADANKLDLVLTTITIQDNNSGGELSLKLEPYNDLLRDVARARRVPLADINRAMAASSAADPAVPLTFDGERLNRAGGILMAESIMRGMGLGSWITPRLRTNWEERPAYFD
jgi:lysophospholipase L1-like esterase